MKFKKVAATIKRENYDTRPADPIPIPEPEPPKKDGILEGLCLFQAKNPQWIYVKLKGVDGKIPVIIPRRLTGKLEGKKVYVESITDATGTSYRYVEELTRSYNGQ